MLKPGSTVPEFILSDENNAEVSLSSLLGSGPLVLYFYPSDFTPGCTREACSIRDIHDDIKSVGLQVVGVSPQDAKSHRDFKKQFRLPFPLLSDPDKAVIKIFDADGPFGIGVRRVTYLIDEDMTIQAAVQADIQVSRHKEFIEKAIELRESSN